MGSVSCIALHCDRGARLNLLYVLFLGVSNYYGLNLPTELCIMIFFLFPLFPFSRPSLQMLWQKSVGPIIQSLKQFHTPALPRIIESRFLVLL
jgi:hypothetical protein